MQNSYHEIERISASDIKLIAESIPHWIAYRNIKPTAEMEFGTAFHTFVLEPENFNKTYIVDNFNKRTNEGKSKINEYKEAGKILITEEDYETLYKMKESYDKLGLDFHKGIIEEPIIFEYLGVECKAKPDVLQKNVLQPKIIDFKTTIDCSDSNIAYSIKKYKYYIQEAFYTLAAGVDNFYFVFCEKKPPFGVRVVNLQRSWRIAGLEEIEKAIDRYKMYKEGYVEPPYEIFLTI